MSLSAWFKSFDSTIWYFVFSICDFQGTKIWEHFEKFELRNARIPEAKTFLKYWHIVPWLSKQRLRGSQINLYAIRKLWSNGDGEIRTLDPLLARQVLSQLSYTPMDAGLPSFEAIPYSFMSCIYFNQPVTRCITLLGNGLKWTRTTDLTLIRRAL